MIVVLDTNAYSAFQRGDEKVIEQLETADEVLVPSIVVGELVSGFLQGTRWESNWADLQNFLDQPGIRFQHVGMAEAEKYGLLVRNLRAAGTPVPTNDIWIAATALAHGAAVLTRDAHFEHFKEILVV